MYPGPSPLKRLAEICLRTKGYDTLGFFPLGNPLIFLCIQFVEQTKFHAKVLCFSVNKFSVESWLGELTAYSNLMR
jgi:hypothetical protein